MMHDEGAVLRSHGITREAPGALVNEDAFAAVPALGLFVVADGLAGRPAGDVASRIAVESIVASVRGGTSLPEAMEVANHAVVAASRDDARLEQMCAAVTAVQFTVDAGGHATGAQVVHAGDCRCYVLRDGQLRMLTEDHLRVERRRRIITKVLGRERPVEPDVIEVPACPGDRWLLCTDGLTKVVDDEEIADLLADATDPVVAAGGLLDAARAHETPDDTTIVAVQT